jgi:hypothetical protein
MLPETDLTIVQKILISLSDFLEEGSLEKVESILKFTLEPNFPWWVDVLKALSFAFILFFIWIIYRGMFKSSWFDRMYAWKYQDLIRFGKEKHKTSSGGDRKWNTIEQRLKSGREDEFKLAILEADSLLGETLIKMGYKELTIEENIKKVGSNVLSNIDTLITIRQIRNNIVSDPDYKINLDQAKRTMAIYKKAFSEIQLI